MKRKQAMIGGIFLLVFLFAYQLFKAQLNFRREYNNILVAEGYYKSLDDYRPDLISSYVTYSFMKDLETQSQQSPVFSHYLNFFKTDTKKYPINLTKFLFKHMAIHPSPPNNIVESDSSLFFELYVGSSLPTKIQFCFERRKDRIRLDSISNLYLFFERLDCKRNELLMKLDSAAGSEK